MTAFDKPALTVDQHLDILRQRGLTIPDVARARHSLGNISYYRRSAYTRPFYRPGPSKHVFLDGMSFDEVLHLYVFDRELRLLLLDAIERLEVALRAQLANTLAEHHGPHAYLDASLFPMVSRPHMGFPPDWEKEAFWNDAVSHAIQFLRSSPLESARQ